MFDQTPDQFHQHSNEYLSYGKATSFEVKNDPSYAVPSDPQVFAVEDCIVFILKPTEFFRYTIN